MHFLSIQRIFGVLLLVFSITQIPPALIALFVGDGSTTAFVSAYLITMLTGLLLWMPVRRRSDELGTKEGFLVVALFWVVLALFGALPLYIAPHPNLTVTDAVFESMSGLTTTGATIMVGIDDLPLSIRYYRQQLQWLGGMGIIVLAVAVLPMLGIGGMQLYKAEIAGPVKNSKLTARITETAKALWYIYLGLTLACGLAYWLAGMTPFDAICHAFSTVAIGGFSTHDASLASLSHGFHDPQTTPSQQSLATGGRPRAGGLMQPRRAVGGTQPTFTQAASHSQPKQRVLQQGSLQRLCAFPTTGKLPFLTALVATPQAPAGADAGRQPPSVGLMHSKSAPGFSY